MASRPQADTQGFQWKLRRMVDNIIHFATARTTKVYPKTTGALQSLREAVNEEMPVKRRRIALDNPGSRKRKSPGTLAEVTSRRHYQKMRRLEKINKELLIKIASHTAAKTAHTKHNYIAPDWLVRVFFVDTELQLPRIGEIVPGSGGHGRSFHIEKKHVQSPGHVG